MNKRLVIGAIALGIVFYAGHSSTTKERALEPAPEASLNQIQANPMGRVLAGLKPTPLEKKIPTERTISKPALPFQAELSDYERLTSKVLLTGQEVQERAALLANAQVLKGLAQRLITPATDLQAKEDQDAILELELTAIKEGNRQAAREALATVAADKQIEDAKMPAEARKNLAGVKAEALFEWSAQDPDQAQKIGSLLPGPVSQRIWRNVAQLQSQDLAASAAVH